MLIYLAGLYSRGDIDANVAAARKVAIALWEMGYWVLTPHLNMAHFEVDCKASYEDYIDGDLRMMKACDAVVMLPGWKDSPGARAERLVALDHGMTVVEWPDVPARKIDGGLRGALFDEAMKEYRRKVSELEGEFDL